MGSVGAGGELLRRLHHRSGLHRLRRGGSGLVAADAHSLLPRLQVGGAPHRLNGAPTVIQGLEVDGCARGQLEVRGAIGGYRHRSQHGSGRLLTGQPDGWVIADRRRLGEHLDDPQRLHGARRHPVEPSIDILKGERAHRRSALGQQAGPLRWRGPRAERDGVR